MKILHTEASNGWGGQEMRILSETLELRKKGYEIIWAIEPGGELLEIAKKHHILAYQVPFQWLKAPYTIFLLIWIMMKHKIDIVNTHSSLDAWLAGLAAKIMGKKVIRTRHLSNVIKTGLNSVILYKWLADFVVTTCKETERTILEQAKLPSGKCRSIPTGVNPLQCKVSQEEAESFREKYGIAPDDVLVGTLCILRSWKGIEDLLKAAKILKQEKKLRWIIVGDGPIKDRLEKKAEELDVLDKVSFIGFISPPYQALLAMDIFMLLSTRSEGISQAMLQAAFLGKPLVATPTGGLKEVCLHEYNGLQVSPFNADEVAMAVQQLAQNKELRDRLGHNAKQLVEDKFLLSKTIDDMEQIYDVLAKKVDVR